MRCHLDNFFFDNQPTYTIGTGAVAEGPFWYEDEIMRLPRYKAHVDQDLARYIMRRAVEEELPVSQSEEFRIDHAFTLPLSYFRPEQDLPIVPIITNAFGYPIPENDGWYRLGQFLKKIVYERPAGERIAIACSFNMTVDVGGPKMGKYNKEFSDNMLAMMREGALAEMLEKLTIKNLVAQGNSTAEFLNYFAILGVVEDRPPTYIEHKPVKGVGTCPVVMWDMN